MTQWRRKVWKVTEWKNGCVFKTKEVGEVWIDDFDDGGDLSKTLVYEKAIAQQHGGDFLGSMPTGTPWEQYQRTI